MHIVQPADELPVFHQEGNFVGSNFEHGAGSLDFAGTVAEAGIEEAGVVNAKFAVGRIEGNHLSGEVGRDTHSLPGRENIECAWLEDQAFWEFW